MFFRAITVCSCSFLGGGAVGRNSRPRKSRSTSAYGSRRTGCGGSQYRWERAVELDPTYAEAWNNLAIAYEHSGKFDDARKAYETAIKLDPKNTMIRQNYDLFKEINDRTQKRRGSR